MRILLLVFLVFFICQLGYGKGDDAIVLPMNHWASQKVLTKVVGQKIEQLGFKVVYQNIGSVDQIGALRKGIVHLQVELWQSEGTGDFSTKAISGNIEEVGLHSARGREEWWYPSYVEEMCEGLPDWKALNRCAHLFANDTSGKKGVFYTGPWNYRDADLIHGLKLNFIIKRLNNADEIWQELRKAVKQRRPIVLLNWTPNWVDVRIEGKFVEFPEFNERCESDPEWGENKKLVHDCGNPRTTHIKKVAWPGLKQRWPCVYALLKKIDFTADMISEASALYAADGYSEQQSIKLWLEKYAPQSQPWLSHQCSTL